MKRLKDSPFSLSCLAKANKDSVRVKSVISPSAQSNTPCAIDLQGISSSFNFERDVVANPALPEVVKAVVELQYRYALRISEVLSISAENISKSGKIKINALKGSESRIIEPFSYKSYWTGANKELLPLSHIYSRFYFYRFYKKLGWYATFGNSSTRSVTHYFRHLQGLELQNDFSDITLTARSLGHKSIKSTEYYVRKAHK